jgi:hypothetical protein
MTTWLYLKAVLTLGVLGLTLFFLSWILIDNFRNAPPFGPTEWWFSYTMEFVLGLFALLDARSFLWYRSELGKERTSEGHL